MLFLWLIYSDRQNLSCSPPTSRVLFPLLCPAGAASCCWNAAVTGSTTARVTDWGECWAEMHVLYSGSNRVHLSWTISSLQIWDTVYNGLARHPPPLPFFSVSSLIIANKVLIYFLCSFFSAFLFVILLDWILPPWSGISPLFLSF